ncbi:putative transmembrane protein [Labilithrix luteola]|uniref:Putative transmembrane protein n=1 Tax=Labilithrix luteola TaxID=1391654 RepID=A0A0K1Q5D9_9BACT|nr:DUF1345 domain-containing protein [Labilithrix luteola]AKV00620.1 putative transmembrane protein [Labilithrix luteola]
MTTEVAPSMPQSALSPHRSVGRFFIALVLALFAVGLFTPIGSKWWASLVIGWDAFSITFLLLKWRVIAGSDITETRAKAGTEDPGGTAVFVISLVASLFSLFAAAFVLSQVRHLTHVQTIVWTTMTLLGVVFAWTVVHTASTLRYAHLYYEAEPEGGLDFPAHADPDAMDFAYFAFTIAMCYQVSDVAVTSAHVRKVVLLHSVVSFVFNTTILALAVNLVINFMS